MGGGHRRGVSGGAGRTGEDWNPIGGNRRDEASAGYRRRSAAVMTRIADEDMNVGDGYVSSLAGGGRTQMTMHEGPQQPTGGMVGFVVDGPMRTNVNEMMRMGIRRDRERMTSEVGQNSHVAGDVVGDEHDMEIAGVLPKNVQYDHTHLGDLRSQPAQMDSTDITGGTAPESTNDVMEDRGARDMDFYDYLNAHTAKRSPADARGGLVTPMPVKSVLTSVADALENETRSGMARDVDRSRLGRISSYESFRCGSQDPEVPFSRDTKVSVAPISPPPKPHRNDNRINESVATGLPNRTAHYQSSLPPLQTAAADNSQYGTGALLSPLSPFQLRSPFPELYPPTMLLQSPEVQPAPALSPVVQALHPVLVPVRQEDGSDIWMQSITPLSPSKQEAIYQNALDNSHEHMRNSSRLSDPSRAWDRYRGYPDLYDEPYHLMSPTSTPATSDVFGWTATSPIHTLSPDHASPAPFGQLDPMSPSAMYPSFTPFEALAAHRDGLTTYSLEGLHGSQRSSSGSGSTPPSGESSRSGASAGSQHQYQSEQHSHAEAEIQWEHILAEVDRKRNSAASSGNLSYRSYGNASPRFAPTAAGARTSYSGLSNSDARPSLALPVHSQSPSPTRMPAPMRLRPVIDTSVAQSYFHGVHSEPAHKRATSLVSPTSILSGDSIWGAPGDMMSPVGVTQGFAFQHQMEQTEDYQHEKSRSSGGSSNGQQQRWSSSSSDVNATAPDHTYYPMKDRSAGASYVENHDGGTRLERRTISEDRSDVNGFRNNVSGHYTYSDVLKLGPGLPNGTMDTGHGSIAPGEHRAAYQMHLQSEQRRAEAQSQQAQANHARDHTRMASDLDKAYHMARDSEEVTTAYGLLPHGLFVGTPEPSGAGGFACEIGSAHLAFAGRKLHADMEAATPCGFEAQYDPSIPVAEELLKSKLRSDPARLNRQYFDALSKSILEVVQQVRMGGGKGAGRWEQERERLGGVVKTVKMIVESVFPGASVHQVGSTVSGLALADADLDFTVLFPRGTNYTAVQCVERLAGALKQDGPFGEVKPLPRAKVPILKLKDMATGIRCDISFGNELALYNTKLLATYALVDPRVRQMTVFLKYWVKRKGINFPVMGHPSSYCYTLLVINFLQRRNVIPSLQTLAPDGSAAIPERLLTTSSGTYNVYFHSEPDRLLEIWQTENQETVGELLLAFFKDFGTELDFVYKVSSVRTGGLLHKAEKNWSKDSANGRSGGGRIKHWMAVEDPFDLEQNLSSSVDRDLLHAIRGHFQVASKILCGATDLPASKSFALESMGTTALARSVVEKILEECEPLKRGGAAGRSGFGGGGGRRGRKV